MQEHKVILTWEAIYDVTDIAEYIEAEFGQDRADRFQLDIDKQLEHLEYVGTMLGKTDLLYRGYPIYKKVFSPSIIFYILLNLERRLKIAKGFKNIFDAYLCLVMQQTGYFCRHRMEDSVSGLTLDGELIFCKNPHPFSDLGSYALEKYLPDFICGKKALTPDMIYKAFQPYGYSFRDSSVVY